jgi:uncharacterized RmlC-like cupin family protein
MGVNHAGRLHQIRADQLVSETGQTEGMRRAEAISSKTVGSTVLWMGETRINPEDFSKPHHHGDSETGIYVVSGRAVFVFPDGEEEVELDLSPGDYLFVPRFVPHLEGNPSKEEEAVLVIARTTPEAIVENLESLRP